jgi:hypothetical protein
MNNISIRRAERTDCSRLLELVNELAIYEKAPEEVTVSLNILKKVALAKSLFGGVLWPP